MEMFNWNLLGSYAGATFAVAVLTQITKGIPFVKRVPTQLWSYALALITLLVTAAFGPGLTPQGAVLALVNAALVSLSSNGGYAAVTRLKAGLIEPDKEELDESTGARWMTALRSSFYGNLRLESAPSLLGWGQILAISLNPIP